MSKSMKQFRQGDVYFDRISRLPADVRPVAPEGGRLIIMRGEATGHHHSVAVADGRSLALDRQDVLYMTVEQLTEVEHQEHAPITVEPGVYRVTRQREWTDADEPRYVGD